MAQLNGYVTAVNPDTGMTEILDPTVDLPSWANAKSIPNPAAWTEQAAEASADPAEDATDPAYPKGDPSDAWKLDELKAYAAARGLGADLQDATRKSHVLDAIKVADESDEGNPPA